MPHPHRADFSTEDSTTSTDDDDHVVFNPKGVSSTSNGGAPGTSGGGQMRRTDTITGSNKSHSLSHGHGGGGGGDAGLEPPRFPPSTDAIWSSDDDAVVGISSAALGLAIPGAPQWERGDPPRRRTTLGQTPFSRPPSTVTHPPSRTGSAAPPESSSRPSSTSPLTRASPSPAHRRLSKRMTMDVQPTAGGGGGHSPRKGTAGHDWDGLVRSGSSMGTGMGAGGGRARENSRGSEEHSLKGKEKERPMSRSYDTPLTNDLLDPLSSVHYNSLPPPPPTSSSTLPNGHHSQKGVDPAITFPRYPSSESIASTSKHPPPLFTQPPAQPPPQQQQPPQQSLQQILQTVDLSAALKLVQTLQTQSSQKAAVAQTLPEPINAAVAPPSTTVNPTSPTGTSFAPKISPPNVSPTRSTFLPNLDSRTPLPSESHPTSNLNPNPNPPSLHPHHISIEEPPPNSRTRRLSILSNGSPTIPHSTSPDQSQRRRSISIGGFGVGAGGIGKNRDRAGSGASSLGSLGKIRERDRVPDERAVLGEGGRSFEEQISKVHLTLSPATLRRAQNCSKYLSLRYTPIYASIDSGLPPPNPLAVSRFREERSEIERQRRRTLMGTSGRMRAEGTSMQRSSDAGSSINNGVPGTGVTNGPLAIASFGPRRNKHPKVWEIYPDDLAEFVAAEGKVQPLSNSATTPGTPERPATIGSSLHDVTSRHSSDQARSSISIPGNGHGQANGSPLSLYGKSPERDRRFSARPGFSRENSYEGSPLNNSTRSTRGSLELPILHRASSLTSNGSLHGPPKSPFSNLGAISSNDGFNGGNDSFSRVFMSAHPSREYLPHDSSGSPKLGNSTSAPPTRHRQSTSDGLRSLGRKVFSKTTDAEGSEVGRSRRVTESNVEMDYSDAELSRRSSRVAGNMSDSVAFRSSRLKKLGKSPGGGLETDEYRSSGGEEGRARRFMSKKGVGSMGKLFGGRGGRVMEVEGIESLMREEKRPFERMPIRRLWLPEESDDEEKPARPILVLSDEDVARLTGLARQARGKLTQVDAFLPRIPTVLNTQMDDLKLYERETVEDLGIPVHYTFPRLPAAAVAVLASSRNAQASRDDETDTDSESSTETSSSDTSDEEDDHDPKQGLRYRPRRRNTSSQPAGAFHPRNVTDPISRPVTTRPRSQTIGSPTRLGDSVLRHPSGRRVDPLTILDKAIEDLGKAVLDADSEATKVKERQDSMLDEINTIVEDVRAVQKEINETNFQQLRTLEGHYSHLRASLTRPSPTIDTFWAICSYVFSACLWIAWLIFFIVRLLAIILSLPIRFIRWLFFIRP